MLPRSFATAVATALVALCGAAPALADDGWDGAGTGTSQVDDPYDGRLDGVGNTAGTSGTSGDIDDFLGPGGPDDPADPAAH